MREPSSGTRHAIYWALFVAAFVFRAYGNASQPALDDEVAAAFSADNYLRSGMLGRVMWYHPQLRNFVIFLSGQVFGGYSAWGLRGGSILLGSLSIPLLGYLGDALFRRTAIGALAAFFLCIDPLHIGLSRQAFQESTTLFFILAGTLSAVHAAGKGRAKMHYLSGLCFGLATASKWHGLFPWVVCAMYFLFSTKAVENEERGAFLKRKILLFVAAYVALPMTVYLASYAPWFARGHSLAEFADFQLWLVRRQYIHRASEYAETYLSRRAWMWFLWPTAWTSYVFYQGTSYLNIAMGNFLVWVMTLPSLGYMFRKWLRERATGSGMSILLFVASYLPLVLTTLSVYVFSAPAVLPFAFLLIAATADRLMEQQRLPRGVLAVYLVLVLVLSSLMYPLSTLRALEYPYLRPLVEIYNPHGEGHR